MGLEALLGFAARPGPALPPPAEAKQHAATNGAREGRCEAGEGPAKGLGWMRFLGGPYPPHLLLLSIHGGVFCVLYSAAAPPVLLLCSS